MYVYVGQLLYREEKVSTVADNITQELFQSLR